MAPQLFARQLAHGAWGITAATPHQVRVYRTFGVRHVFLANELVDAAALRWVARELAADPEFRFVCYVDSVRGVELMDAALTAVVDVVVELGAEEAARARADPRRRRASPTRSPRRGTCGSSVSRATRRRPRTRADGSPNSSRWPGTSTRPGGSQKPGRSW